MITKLVLQLPDGREIELGIEAGTITLQTFDSRDGHVFPAERRIVIKVNALEWGAVEDEIFGRLLAAKVGGKGD